MPHERRRDPAALEARIRRLGWHFIALSHAADAAAKMADRVDHDRCVTVPCGDDRDESKDVSKGCSCGLRR